MHQQYRRKKRLRHLIEKRFLAARRDDKTPIDEAGEMRAITAKIATCTPVDANFPNDTAPAEVKIAAPATSRLVLDYQKAGFYQGACSRYLWQYRACF
jgi:hypothetical protein